MKVFISWSGPTSRQIAEALREWLPMMLQDVDLFMSRKDTDPGARWQDVIAQNLAESDYGLLVMTKDNLDSKWLHFEGGALSKAVASSHVVPLLYELRPADVEMPLAQFQMKTVDEEGIRELIDGMNRSRSKPLEESHLNGLLEALWPKLQEALAKVQLQEASKSVEPPRDDSRLLEEILEIVRGMQRRETLALPPAISRGVVSVRYTGEDEAEKVTLLDLLSQRSGDFGAIATAVDLAQATVTLITTTYTGGAAAERIASYLVGNGIPRDHYEMTVFATLVPTASR